MRPSVENACDRVISFLSTRVPEHHLEESLFIDVSCNCCEFGTYGYFMIGRKRVRTDPFYYARFSNT